MDLLYQRYADPFSFLSRAKNFSKTIKDIWNTAQEEKIFEMYLHSYSEKSFDEYKEELLNSSKNKEDLVIDDEEKKEIIKNSTNILNNFSPSEI